MRLPEPPLAPEALHPLATVRQRNSRIYPPGTELVPCGHCRADMPAARLQHSALNGECTTCCKDRWAARPAAPVYETDAWSRGERL